MPYIEIAHIKIYIAQGNEPVIHFDVVPKKELSREELENLVDGIDSGEAIRKLCTHGAEMEIDPSASYLSCYGIVGKPHGRSRCQLLDELFQLLPADRLPGIHVETHIKSISSITQIHEDNLRNIITSTLNDFIKK